MAFPLRDILTLRFILRQPSPLWKEFRIDDIRLYKSPLKVKSCIHFSFIVESHVHQASSILSDPWQRPSPQQSSPGLLLYVVCSLSFTAVLVSFSLTLYLEEWPKGGHFYCDIVECSYHISRSWEHVGCCITLP